MRVLRGLCAVFALLVFVTGCSDDAADPAPTTSTVTVSKSVAPEQSSAAPAETTTTAPTTTAPSTTPADPTAGALPASDFADGTSYSFASPSKKIECRTTSETLVCQTLDNRHTVDPSLLCGFYPGDEQGNANQFGFFDFDKPLCATIVQGNAIRSPNTLAYGQRVVFRPRPDLTIVCSAATVGIACVNPDGFGFTLSDTEFKRFRAN
ncbi:hypothetical protein [Williamsia phyllosphaerae]|uniref:Uncharacterized protein n=1 Tax=Williamsia phyllosphaerae TaxID=885042 RepID=A0ABQ1UFL7_9NOCA|nr:hypothetical protein [Williamsia phyllosphaerae]GGF15166.1 hypothetical protein GCM10007298_09010 [Williamsia phyllosphaerae]